MFLRHSSDSKICVMCFKVVGVRVVDVLNWSSLKRVRLSTTIVGFIRSVLLIKVFVMLYYYAMIPRCGLF